MHSKTLDRIPSKLSIALSYTQKLVQHQAFNHVPLKLSVVLLIDTHYLSPKLAIVHPRQSHRTPPEVSSFPFETLIISLHDSRALENSYPST